MEEEEVINNNLLYPPPIAASEDADTYGGYEGNKDGSIQDKVVNLLHYDKDNNKTKEKNILWVLY